MRDGARTPEELESLFEDAFVLRDPGAVAPLFEPRALLATAGIPGAARGSEQIARSASALWTGDYTYLADPRRIVQAHDLALVLGERVTHVVRRGGGGVWRYAISLLSMEPTTKEMQ